MFLRTVPFDQLKFISPLLCNLDFLMVPSRFVDRHDFVRASIAVSEVDL